MKRNLKMEKEILGNKSKRYAESGLYCNLQELHPDCYDIFLNQLVKVVRSSNEREILQFSDILLEFASNERNPEKGKKIVEVTVDEIFPFLNKKDPENVKELVSSEYKTVMENLEKIKEFSDEETVSKCLFGEAILTSPGS